MASMAYTKPLGPDNSLDKMISFKKGLVHALDVFYPTVGSGGIRPR